jgi:hypothetical protein
MSSICSFGSILALLLVWRSMVDIVPTGAVASSTVRDRLHDRLDETASKAATTNVQTVRRFMAGLADKITHGEPEGGMLRRDFS